MKYNSPLFFGEYETNKDLYSILYLVWPTTDSRDIYTGPTFIKAQF